MKRLTGLMLFPLVVVVLGACMLIAQPGVSAEAGAGHSPENQFDSAAFDSFVEQVLTRYRVPGLAIALVHRDQVLVVKGYGKRRFDAPDPVDPQTLFALASVTKSFTAALLATYVDEKRLEWDRQIIEDFPELVFQDMYTTRMATPRDLLAHRTGLPAFTGDLFDRLGYDRNEVLRRIRLVEPACSFRERGNYSNLGYFAAGMLAARVDRKDWETLMQTRLFEPMGMRTATFTYRVDPAHGNLAAAHYLEGDSYSAMPWVPQETLAPAGGMAASISDMVPFLKVQLAEGKLDGKTILSPQAIAEMHRPAMVDEPGFTSAPPVDSRSGLAFAMGWDSYHFRGYEVIEKGGALGGTRTVVTMIPELKVGVAVFANLNLTLATEAIRGQVLEQFTDGKTSDLQDRIWQTQQKLDKMFDLEPATKRPPAGPPSRPLVEYTGSYNSPLYGDLHISMANDKLRWSMGTEGYAGAISHVGFDTFQMEFPPGTITLPEPVTFVLDADGQPTDAISDLLGRMPRVVKD